jgi:hypothetical protein
MIRQWDSKVTDFDAKDFTGRKLQGEIPGSSRGRFAGRVYFSVIGGITPIFSANTSCRIH